MAMIGKVVAMTGVAFIITGNGSKRELKLGDQVQTSDSIQTSRGVDVDLELATGRVIHIGSEQLVAFTEELTEAIVPSGLESAINLATIDTVISAIESGKDINEVLEETAAGPGGVRNSYGFGFVDLLRINDDLNNFKFAYEYNTDNRLESNPAAIIDDISNGLQPDTAAPLAPVNAPPVATPLAIGNLEGSGPVSGNLIATDANGDPLTYSAIGALPLGLVLNPDGSFTFDYSDPAYNALSVGVPQILNVPYLVSDGKGGTSTSTLTITVTGTNDAPVASATTISPIEDTPINVPLSGTDVDGTIASFTITAGPTPAQGTLVYDDDGLPGTPSVAVPLNTALTPAQAASVEFVPAPNYNGPVDPVTYIVTDNDGAPSTPAIVTINDVSPVIDTVLVSLTGPGAVVEGAVTTAYTVSLPQTAISDVTVNLTYTGTASNGNDYTGVLTIIILEGSNNATFTLPTLNDVFVDNGETIIVTLGGITGGGFEAIAANPVSNTVTTIITDDVDTTTVTLSADASIVEGNNITYTATLTNPAQGAVTVTLSNGAIIT
ncbi:MAG: retention module-containing protein, partial [Methylotenera sp.]|nr:retention module-containing protein [Methylotenera sp.]